MASSELFILGDARFLSGGAPRSCASSYDSEPPKVYPAEALTTERLLSLDEVRNISAGRNRTRSIASVSGQNVHSGRDSYHEHTWHRDRCLTRPNIFIAEGDVPTAGVEIETYARDRESIDKMREELWSNWFHFEEDGSLDRVQGHELITDILSPRVYRDLRTWVGLQNLTAPWLDSYNRPTTGLHVHVGVDQFFKCESLPCNDLRDRVKLAKIMIAFCYHGLVDTTFLDRVFLRKGGNYCAAAADKRLLERADEARNGGILAGDLEDLLFSAFCDSDDYSARLQLASLCSTADSFVGQFTVSALSDSCRWMPRGFQPRYVGHNVELNLSHPYTIEFRRGKGTLNAISIHRMVEFTTLVVRYVWKACREPSMTVSPATLYAFIKDNTSSNALKTMAEEQYGKLPKKG